MTGVRSSRPLFVGLLCLSATAAYFFWNWRSDSEAKMAGIDHPRPQLAVSLRQATSPTPGVVLKVTNSGPTPVTILTWESPLDPLALQLGLVSLTPEGAKEPSDIPVIQVSRQLPPGEDSLVSLDPGASKENEITFREPIVPLNQMKGKVAVSCKGRWMSVWSARRSELSAETIGNLGAGDGTSFSDDFRSNSIEMDIS